MTLSDELSALLKKNGAAEVGYGDLSDLPENTRKSMKYGISIIVTMTPSILAGVKNGPTAEYYGEYGTLEKQLDKLCAVCTDFLKARGFEAFPQDSASVVENEAKWETALPHKTVATKSGIGWIGKCATLVTEKYGSAVRLTSVLTNAPLEVSAPVTKSRCGNCTVCRDVCPAKAVSGKLWSLDTARNELLDPFACRKTARAMTAKIGIAATLCGQCILNCPYTQKYLEKCLHKDAL